MKRIKIRSDFFKTPKIESFLAREEGADLLIIYLKLCLLCADCGGLFMVRSEVELEALAREINELPHYLADALEAFKEDGLVTDKGYGLLKIKKMKAVRLDG